MFNLKDATGKMAFPELAVVKILFGTMKILIAIDRKFVDNFYSFLQDNMYHEITLPSIHEFQLL